MAHMYLPAEGSDTIDKDDPIELVKFAKEIEATKSSWSKPGSETLQMWAINPPTSDAATASLLMPAPCSAMAAITAFKLRSVSCWVLVVRRRDAAAGLEYDPDQLRSLQMEARNIGVPIDQYLAVLRNKSVEEFEKDKAIAAKTTMKGRKGC